MAAAATVETHLNRSQELVYRGSFSETAAQFARPAGDRAFRVETRIFVLDAQPKNSSTPPSMTILKPRDNRPAQPGGNDSNISSIRLERVQIDSQGKLTPAAGRSLSVPLDGLPLLESGAFVEVPKGRIVTEQTWQVGEDNRPPRSWRVAGTRTGQRRRKRCPQAASGCNSPTTGISRAATARPGGAPMPSGWLPKRRLRCKRVETRPRTPRRGRPSNRVPRAFCGT